MLQPLYTIGNVGRNTVIGPQLVSFDFSIFKQFKFQESKSVQFRTEIFNIFNHPNFGSPNQANRTIPFNQNIPGTMTPSPAGTPPSGPAGTITTTVTTSRQIQFGLKFIF